MAPEDVAELRRLARSRPTSGRAQLAKLGAIRTLERLAREEAQRQPEDPPGKPQGVKFLWEMDGPVDRGWFELMVNSEVERVLFGVLAGPHHRPDHERERINRVAERLLEAPDPVGALREGRTGCGLVKPDRRSEYERAVDASEPGDPPIALMNLDGGDVVRQVCVGGIGLAL